MDKSSKQSKDIFDVSKKNVERFFNEVEKSAPKYHQSVSKLQQDYISAWKTVINSAISLEQEYAHQNKIAVDTSEATKLAFKTFNQNTKSFATLNKEIMGYIMSVFEQKINT